MPRRAVNQFNRRQEKSSGAAPRGPIILGLSAVVIIVVLVLAFRGGGEDVEEEPALESLSLVEALMRVDAAHSIAQLSLESGEAEAMLEAQREDDARRAVWVEGAPAVVAGELQKNESLFLALQRRQIPGSSIHFSVNAMGEEFNFRRSRPGDEWRAEIDAKGRIIELRYQTSPEDIWITTRLGQGEYSTEKLDIDVEVKVEAVAGTITSSLWLALEATGESGVLAHRFMEIFQYSIDFNTETRDGDHFALVFEKVYLDGEFLRYGRVLAAKYVGARARQEAFYFETANDSGYYARNGDSMKRQFLRSPLEVTRVTSRFGRRVHPITGDSRMHRGVDYGAPVGTRVQAVANGTVHFAGWRGGYGKLLILRHSGGYETRYAHLSSFSPGVRAGARVSQGQIVARSGNTGNTTGPHLHYEMLQNGRHIDPLSVRATSGDPLRGADLAKFKGEHLPKVDAMLQEVFSTQVPEAAAMVTKEDDED